MLVELGLRNRVELQRQGMRRRGILSRKVIVKNGTMTGDVLLDEALKHVKETDPPDSVQNWIELLSGKFVGWQTARLLDCIKAIPCVSVGGYSL